MTGRKLAAKAGPVAMAWWGRAYSHQLHAVSSDSGHLPVCTTAAAFQMLKVFFTLEAGAKKGFGDFTKRRLPLPRERSHPKDLYIEVFYEEGRHLSFCSSLHASWAMDLEKHGLFGGSLAEGRFGRRFANWSCMQAPGRLTDPGFAGMCDAWLPYCQLVAFESQHSDLQCWVCFKLTLHPPSMNSSNSHPGSL